jgi:hypothetical protein
MRQQEIKAIPAFSEFPKRAIQNAHKPQCEIRKRALREMATTVKIVLTRRIGMIHHSLVFLAAFQAACEVTRNRPETMCGDAALMRYRMAHQPANAPVPITERMDVNQN